MITWQPSSIRQKTFCWAEHWRAREDTATLRCFVPREHQKPAMSELFVVSNQLGQYWGKKKRWVDGTNARKVMTLKHQDEGFNLLVELSSRDVDLRGEVLTVATNDRRVPQVEPSEHLIAEIEETPSEETPSDPEGPSDPEEADPEEA
jgi:hypothetical protein